MTRDALKRLIREACDIGSLEDHLKSAIVETIDYDEIAYRILSNFEDELNELAAEVFAEAILPF